MQIGYSPKTIEELLKRANQLAGLSLHELAQLCHTTCPKQLHHAKGWLGQTLERFLGSDAGSQAIPDFAQLSVELKTLPLTPQGKPKESTYVTYAPIPFEESDWRLSTVYHKLHQVLWIPFLAAGPIPQRTIATPFLSTLDGTLEQSLKRDWEELSEILRLQQFSSLTAKTGRFLHIRPKAANSKTFVNVLNENDEMVQVVPKGFYLRPSFTQALLQNTFSA